MIKSAPVDHEWHELYESHECPTDVDAQSPFNLKRIRLNGEWNFYNAQSQAVAAEDNYWGAGMTNDTIEASIKGASGSVGYYPHREGQAPCAPVPELSTIALFTVGLLLLLGYVRMARGR